MSADATALPPDSTTIADDEPIIRVREVSIRFDAQTVLHRIGLDIRRGETLAIIGESGCGKTVLMKTMIGLLRPDQGSVWFDNHQLGTASQAELARLRRRIGFVFQNAALFDSLNIFDNVAFPILQHEPAAEEREVARRVREGLAEVGLPAEVADKYPAELSGGMRKRVGLARALILQPDLIIYDEPTTGLDPIMSDVINELILATRRNHPVTSVVVTHDMRTARKVANRVVMLYPHRRLKLGQSQILFDGSPSDLDHADDRRVRQFVRGEAGERIDELTRTAASIAATSPPPGDGAPSSNWLGEHDG